MKHAPFLKELKRTGFKSVAGNRLRFMRKREMQKTQIVDVPAPPEVKQDTDKSDCGCPAGTCFQNEKFTC